MQTRQTDTAAQIQSMINHLAAAGVASETFVTGMTPVLQQAGVLSAQLGSLYADARGAVANRLEKEYGFEHEYAIAASESVDRHIDKVLDIVAAVLLSKQ